LETCRAAQTRRPEERGGGHGLPEELGPPELGPELGRKDLHQPRVACGRRRRGKLEEARGSVRARAWLVAACATERSRCRTEAGQRRYAARQLDGGVALVAAERLVAAVARQRDGDVPAREL